MGQLFAAMGVFSSALCRLVLPQKPLQELICSVHNSWGLFLSFFEDSCAVAQCMGRLLVLRDVVLRAIPFSIFYLN